MIATATPVLKLFRARIELEFLVAARDEREAEIIASRDAEEVLSDEMPWANVTAVRRLTDLSGDEAGSIPYGDGEDVDDRTAAEILEGAVKLDESNGPVHWCEECGRERVAFDWTQERQVCRACKAEEVDS